MKKIISTINLLSFLFLLSFISSCSKSPKKEIDPEFAKYIAAFTYGNVYSSSEIQIELTQDIPAVQLNQEVKEELFKFSPNIKGKTYWVNTHTVKFVPEPGELKSGKEYDYIFRLDNVLKVDSKLDEFHSHFYIPDQNFKVDLLPYSPMKDNNLTWNSVQGELSLADYAEPEKLAKMFTLSGGDTKDVKIKITPSETKCRYNIQIDSIKRDNDNDITYTLNIDGSPIGIDKNEKLTIDIPKINTTNFSIIDTRIEKGAKGTLRITFSDPLSVVQNIEGLISINDMQNFSYDIQKNVLKIYIDNYRGGSKLDLKLFKQIKSTGKKSLDKDYSFSLAFEQNKPEIKLINSGNILPNSENLVIPFRAVNLWAVDVNIYKIFENNILGYLQTNDFGGSSELKRFGRLIKKTRIRLDTDPTMKLDEWNNFSLDLAQLIKQDPGAIYKVEFKIKQDYSLYPCEGVVPVIPKEATLERFESLSEDEIEKWDTPQQYYYYEDDGYYDYDWEGRDDPCKPYYYRSHSDDCIVLASNIGMTAKMGSDRKIFVALSDILTTKPLAGATVDVYNYQMQVVGSGKTDGDGFASIDYKGVIPFAIVANNGKDKGYLKVTSNLSLSLSNFDVSGNKLQKGLKGYIYGERGVWRPGDSIYLTFILEDKNKTLPEDHPVSLEFYNPQGQLYRQYMATSGKNGFYSFPMSTSSDAITGNWQARIKVGGATFSKVIRIETIKPNRLKIRLDVGDMIDASNGKLTGTLSSQWLHGAPASKLKANVELKLLTSKSPFKGYEKYSFLNPASKFVSDTYTVFEGQLDESGNAVVSTYLPEAASAPGMLRANIVSKVFEGGGDASIYMQSVPYSPFSTYVGVKSTTDNPYQWLETDKDNPIDIVTVNANGKPVSRKNIHVKVYKLRWSWWWNNSGENLSSYVTSTSAEVILDQTISTNSNGQGQVKVRVNYPDWGRYLVLATDSEGGHSGGQILYIDWPASMGRSNKEDATGATMLSFSTDKQTYNVGEKVTVTLPKSSNGRALLTLEDGSKIISKEWVTTSADKDTEYGFTVTADMAPNFYIYASLLQPHGQTQNDLPIRMYGVINISVENKETTLDPVISMPNELRPEKEFTVSVSEKNKKDMTYTLAIVDDGLLDITAFKTPNAWNDFYARQALGIRTWDMYDMVVGAVSGKFGPLLSIGGDMEMTTKKDAVNRFKPVVKFIGPFTLGKGKTDTHKITLPPYVGSVRVMAVAGNQNGAYGSAEKTVQVKNPLMILSTLPRVVSPGEEILLPVNVFAMDKKVKNVTVNVKSKGQFKFTDGTSKTLSFTETGDKMVFFKFKVDNKIGTEKVEIKATSGNENASETIDIEIRNPNPPILLTKDALISPQNTESLEVEMESPQPEDWVKLEISRMPAINLNKNLRYLMEYPYGCSEQVTSQAFPLLNIGVFMPMTEKEKERIDFNIKESIKIISSRQASDGSIKYWPQSLYTNEWVTTYAGHFLLEAKRKGYDVSQSVINKWISFQTKAAQSWNMHDLYNSYYTYSMDDLQQAYRLYTLALAEKPELGAMNRLKGIKGLSLQARWRLAAAYALIGKKDAANKLISGSTDVIENYTFCNNTYGSSARDMAMIMETQLMLGNTAGALKLSYRVAEALSEDYVATQTLSYGLIAMSKLAEKMGKGGLSYEWELNGVAQKSSNSNKVFESISIKPQEKINVKVTNKSQGQLFVRLIGYTKPIEDKAPTVYKGVNLYVSYTDVNGSPIDARSLRQGTEFYANVTVQNVSGQYLTDMALSLIFPSGWEIFNQRLFDVGDDTKNFTYQDIRDDRVLTYFNINAGYSLSFKVRLQASYCGRFIHPSVICEAMYNPEYQSRLAGGWLEVRKN